MKSGGKASEVIGLIDKKADVEEETTHACNLGIDG